MPFSKSQAAAIKTRVRHISEQHRREEETAAAERRLRSVFETVPDGVLLLRADGAIVEANHAAAEMLETDSPAEAAQASFFDFVLPDCRPALRAHLDDVLAGISAAVETELEGAKGARRRIEARMIPFRDGPAALLAVCRDVTEHRRLEARLRHVQKMEAIGTLSAGIAHDFNNILTAIIGYANIVKLKLKQEDPLRPPVDQILASSERATALTQSLLAFSRKTAITLRPVNVNETVQRAEKLLCSLIGDEIRLNLTPAEGNATVVADAGQLEQVLIHLATNARDAMPDGGTLSIVTERRDLGPDFIRTFGYGKPGAYVVVTVSDTGTGMDEKTRERIFEPFFTTKDIGQGTGLGLAIVYGIVKQHHGYINCSSKQGRGTTFDMYLPLAKPAAFEPEIKLSFVPRGGTETILLAESDREVRSLTAAYLRDFGYTIVEAENGEEAVRIFAEHRDAIRLLLFEVILPKKNGKEACDAIQALQPGVRALFMSGYTAASLHEKGIAAEELAYLLKPVSPETLLNKVREVLDQ